MQSAPVQGPSKKHGVCASRQSSVGVPDGLRGVVILECDRLQSQGWQSAVGHLRVPYFPVSISVYCENLIKMNSSLNLELLRRVKIFETCATVRAQCVPTCGTDL